MTKAGDLLRSWQAISGGKKLALILMILTLQAATGFFVFYTGGTKYVFTHSMYLPIIIAAVLYKTNGGILAGLAGGVILGPLMPLDVAAGQMQETINWLYRTVFLAGVGAVTGFAFHTLDRVNIAQMQLIAETESLRQKAIARQNLLTTVMERINDGFVALDKDWRYIYVNSAAAKMLRCNKPEDLLGKQIRIESTENVGLSFYQAYRKAMETQQPASLEEYYAPWERWFENRIYPSAEGLTIYFSDITERKRTEFALQQLNEELELRVRERTRQLENKNREMESFAYSVAHDLRAPLRGIDGYSRLLLEDYTECLDENGRVFLHNIRQSTSWMNQLIDDMLAYARLERRPWTVRKTDVRGLVTSLLDRYQTQLQAGGVTVSVQLPDVVLFTDGNALEMVLRNLLDNALKFTRETARPVIEIGVRETENSHILWVKDNGIGFEEKYAEQVFEMFQRLHRLEDNQGSGIGLAMVRKAAERMGGRVWAESRLGQGATFCLEVPKQVVNRTALDAQRDI
ncbi:MAG: Phytochrome-like protein cph1 [Syntrophomonadaceae bacterium]|nr:Phytochrome-like protein cph1 [Bacillota bacterium]